MSNLSTSQEPIKKRYGLFFKAEHKDLLKNATRSVQKKKVWKSIPVGHPAHLTQPGPAKRFISAVPKPQPPNVQFAAAEAKHTSKPKPPAAGRPKPTAPVVQITPVSAVSSGNSVKRALLIGINYTGSRNELKGCINDISNIRNELLQNHGFKPENITFMADNVDLQPTRANMITEMKKIIAATKPGDEVFLHYSGHGMNLDCSNGSESLNQDTPNENSAICPKDFDNYDADSGMIVDEELRRILVNPLPKGARLITFFDCCHSGSILDLPFIYRDGKGFSCEDSKTDSDCLSISGCNDGQTSADAWIAGKSAGALTWGLLSALQSTAKVPGTNWKDFLLVVRHNLAGKYDQIPMLSVSNADIANRPVSF